MLSKNMAIAIWQPCPFLLSLIARCAPPPPPGGASLPTPPSPRCGPRATFYGYPPSLPLVPSFPSRLQRAPFPFLISPFAYAPERTKVQGASVLNDLNLIPLGTFNIGGQFITFRETRKRQHRSPLLSLNRPVRHPQVRARSPV